MAKKENGNKENLVVSTAVTEDSLSFDQLSGNSVKLSPSAKSPLGMTYKELHDGLEETIKTFFGKDSELTPKEAYSWIFHLDKEEGTFLDDERCRIQDWMEPPEKLLHTGDKVRTFKGNPIAYSRTKTDNPKTGRFHIMFRDKFDEKLAEIQSRPFAILNGLTYLGKKNKLSMANKMYALMFDIDGVTGQTLYGFLYLAQNYKEAPIPSIITLSGTGVHFVYIFEEPISMTPDMQLWVKWVKYCLTCIIWNDNFSSEERQFQGINQGFRVIGGPSKVEGYNVIAYKCREDEWTLEELEDYITSYDEKEALKRIEKPSRPSERHTTPLFEAKEKWPEWWRSIELEKESGIHRNKGGWTCNPKLYEWWIEKIHEPGACRVGHRYFITMAMGIYAVKSGVPREKLKEDALAIQPYLDAIGGPAYPFTLDDMNAALDVYDNENAHRFSIRTISSLTGIPIEKKPHPDLDKYNAQMKRAAEMRGEVYVEEKMTREKWLEVEARPRSRIAQARYNTDWRKDNGRKSCKPILTVWIINHPYASQQDASEDPTLGLSINTISKHWKECGGLTSIERADKWLDENPNGTAKEMVDQLGISQQVAWRHLRRYKKK